MFLLVYYLFKCFLSIAVQMLRRTFCIHTVYVHTLCMSICILVDKTNIAVNDEVHQ